ncbi:MAG: hypothetical protein DLM72_13225 [Candidatus Nitrosopolaris wilkensis]|nr:MAG: hypothetical protein DLM72_13225 [Candidatus Nitrosopolaris wilkensis]
MIPADGRNKTTWVKWGQYQDNPVSEKVHNQWKLNNDFINGMAVILGKVWFGQHAGLYFNAIDADNQIAIEEICTRDGKTKSIQELANWTLIEQHLDNLNKMHIYFYSKTPFPKKNSDIGPTNPRLSEALLEGKIPAIEVKGYKGISYCTPSPRNNEGYYWKIIGTHEPFILPSNESWINHIDCICRKYGLKYIEALHGNGNSQIPIKELFNPDAIIFEGYNRHLGLLRVMDSLISKLADIMPLEEIKEIARKRNNGLCKPPFDEREFEKQWKDATKFIQNSREAEDNRSKNKIREQNPIKEVSEAILQHNSLVTLEETDEILRYDNGVYVPGGEVLIRKVAERMCEYDTSNRTVSEIQGHIERNTYHKRSEFDADVNIHNLKNGLYNIENGEFRAHQTNPNSINNLPYLSMNQKPIVYDPKARPKHFIKFLKEVLYPSDIQTLIELMAYTFYRDNPFEIITTMPGSGSNGKTVVFSLLTAVHGIGNVSNLSLKTIIERPFGLYDLVGKDCNLDAELSSGIIQDPAILKKITGRQQTRVEQKNQKAFDTFLHAKLWNSANTIPQTGDETSAYYRRNIVVSFPNTFEERDYRPGCDGCRWQEQEDRAQGIYKLDPDLIDKLTTQEELSGIFNLLMYTLRRMLKNKRIFVNEKTIQQRRDKYEMAANPVESFCRLAIDKESLEDTDWTAKETAYRAYQRFSKHNKLSAVSKEKFGKIMKTKYQEARIGPRDGTRVTAWRGMKLFDKVFADRYITNTDPEQDTLDDAGAAWSDLV